MSRFQELKVQLEEQVKGSSLWQTGAHWYLALPPRDQLVVKGVSLLLLVALVFVIVYAPLLKGRKGAEAALQKNLAVYNQLASNAGRFGSSAAAATSGGSLLSVVTRQAKASGLSLSRYEQDGQGLRIWLDDVSFDDAMTMLEALQSSAGVVANQVNVDKADRPGVVDIRATLSQ
ncbi:MAG: hypothetical protein CMI03_04395 [Oceanospirillaceae bacterium]|uniref:type II secretion system protein GspM n=1 Tax=unclassified Thalassolituus TaxID=2624967 RepID=UPI000C5F8013|nr:MULTISPECIES: type II secretion system protein GspM [unclassified Thalassolituus]MAS25458.1 hypothetical protein [Oceanospirillaceae bacterium]MBL35796.1 hypothetical protein [Oceanospirillaceae bacterium]MBS51975.1 hypothetical protein [Oceanospirillaceae bacterium]|tara:strand:- start:767 stop:1291 length:525 start_codon:yes stop_codon:yes gene_type:complete